MSVDTAHGKAEFDGTKRFCAAVDCDPRQTRDGNLASATDDSMAASHHCQSTAASPQRPIRLWQHHLIDRLSHGSLASAADCSKAPSPLRQTRAQHSHLSGRLEYGNIASQTD
ncbi:hypothetical protein KIN20_018727 [Parelaphostrongylus tenuis]|uniref:Uncharacterized protein n=1 Tax=Parelaphostrongylus tenuis TaxID=148309 RepID=A0AAD5QSB5_PARTN|nr:hypothetical protein KIN20_018727 [Parelaphostrongylus tenuis]